MKCFDKISYELNQSIDKHSRTLANYFGDLIKRETGTPAHEYIQAKVINVAKERIFDTGKSISEVAYGLGFKYPQHFTWLFKQKVGVSPNEYRGMAN